MAFARKSLDRRRHAAGVSLLLAGVLPCAAQTPAPPAPRPTAVAAPAAPSPAPAPANPPPPAANPIDAARAPSNDTALPGNAFGGVGGEAGGTGSSIFAASLFGDFFSAGSGRSSIESTGPGSLQGTAGTVTLGPVKVVNGQAVFAFANLANGGNQSTLSTAGGSAPLTGAVGAGGTPSGPLSLQAGPSAAAAVSAFLVQAVPAAGGGFLVDPAAAALLQGTLHGTGSGTTANLNAAVLALEQQLDPRVVRVLAAAAPLDGNGTFVPGANGSQLAFGTALQSQVVRLLVIDVPSPASGGAYGRTKIAEDNNPLPRDRFIFNADYFENVPMQVRQDVRRYSPGFEKSFANQRMSVEVRLPFASTLSNDVVADGASGGKTQLGNLSVTLKALVKRGRTLNWAAGLGIALPTAADTQVRLADNSTMVRIENASPLLTPYVAALWTPNDEWFAQFWTQVGFDAKGSPVLLNGPGGFQKIGQLTDQNLLSLDFQVGRWLFRDLDGSGWLRGLAPFGELHYNRGLGEADFVQAGSLAIGDLSNRRFEELNLSVGAVGELGRRSQLSVGAVFPLAYANRRTFDYQIGVRLNVFFGATARARYAGAGGALAAPGNF